MSRHLLLGLCLVTGYACSGGGSGSGQPAMDAACTPRGHWLAQEERVGGDCVLDRVPAETVTIESIEDDMTDEDAVWRFQVTRGDVRLESCSGILSEDRCRIEVTCSRDIDDRQSDYALTVELNEMGALEGSSVLTFPFEQGETCQAEFRLDGERVSPLELEQGEEQS